MLLIFLISVHDAHIACTSFAFIYEGHMVSGL